MKLHKYIATGFITMLMGAATSCNEADVPSNNATSEEDNLVDVTIRFATEDAVSTRASVSDGFVPVISKGSQVDVLVYAVYDGDGNLLENYQVNDGKGSGCPSNFIPGSGQNAMGFKAGDEKTILLKVNKDRSYKIACWAQSSSCDAYNTTDLTAVNIDYSKAKNNDELRDAFCGVSPVFSGGTTDEIKITLKRPFAQINVGTTGADFRVSKTIPGGTYYTYSEITLEGVANTLNVYSGVAQTPASTLSATFSLNKIPAYWHMDVPTEETLLDNGNENEEFLQIELDNNEGFLPFKSTYSTVRKDKNGNIHKYLTETFKYMSMCYVLVPGNLEYAVSTKADDGSSLNKVTLTFSGDKEGNETTGVNTSFTLTQVPAKGNYRTNILGGLHDTTAKPYDPDKDPSDPDDPNTDPEDPDYNPEDPTETPEDETPFDPSTLFNSASIQVEINVEYLGDKDPQILN